MEVPPQLVRGVLGSDRGAICGDDGTGYVAGAGRGEKRDGFGDFPGARGTARQGSGPHGFGALRRRAAGVHRAGGTAFTRTPLGLYSAAHARVIEVRRAFLAP